MRYRFRIAVVGKGRCDWADIAVADYSKRLRRHGSLEEITVKPESYRGDVDAVRRAEATRLLKTAKPRDVLIAVDERGKAPDSQAFAGLLGELALEGCLVFAIGGAYGLDESVRKSASRTVRLSNLVMNHEVARVVMYEQLYRGVTLLEGIPYHH